MKAFVITDALLIISKTINNPIMRRQTTTQQQQIVQRTESYGKASNAPKSLDLFTLKEEHIIVVTTQKPDTVPILDFQPFFLY